MTIASSIPANPNDGIDLVWLFRAVWARRYLVAFVTVLFGLGAVGLALTATPMFRAEIVVTEVHDQGMGGVASLATQLGGLASLAGVSLSGKEPGRDSQAILKSRNLASEFIARNNLKDDLLKSATGKTATHWFAVNRFQKDVIGINEDVRKGVTTISIDWVDAKVASEWANEFVRLANDLIRSRALEESGRNIAYLNSQLAKTDAVELRRVLFSLIENETKTLMLANGRAEYAFKVIDPATTPEMRISPRRTLMVIVGVALGGMVGVLLALVLNLFGRSRFGDAKI